jgi:Transposase DDE domain group 1
VKHKDLRPWLSVIAGGESLVSHAGGVLLVETARRSGLAGQLSRLLGRWRKPLAIHDRGKIVADLAVAVALGGDAACDIAVLRAQPGVFGVVASDPTVSRLIARLATDADDAVAAISIARAAARERVWSVAGAPVQDGRVVIDLDATLLDTSLAGTPPKNANASTCAAVHSRCPINRVGRTNMCREHASTITNAHTVRRRPLPGSSHIPSRP